MEESRNSILKRVNLGHPGEREHLGPWASKEKLLDASCTHGYLRAF